MTTRSHLFSLLALSAALALPHVAVAQTFPSKSIRLVVPFGAGGVADLTARTVAQKLSGSLGQPVLVDNPMRLYWPELADA